MSDAYYSTPGATPIADPQELRIPRAQALVEAVVRDRDAELVALSRADDTGSGAVECIVLDITCDGVPSRDSFGIRYRERLALLVSADEGELPVVLALRKDFPALPHQNRVAPSAPASLCLYFEPPRSVLRA